MGPQTLAVLLATSDATAPLPLEHWAIAGLLLATGLALLLHDRRTA